MCPTQYSQPCTDLSQGLAHVGASLPEYNPWAMKDEISERWQKLCEQAADEQDPQKLMELIDEINRFLETKEERLSREQQEREIKEQEAKKQSAA